MASANAAATARIDRSVDSLAMRPFRTIDGDVPARTDPLWNVSAEIHILHPACPVGTLRVQVPQKDSRRVGMDLNLRGKLALVTGASKGIGLACARQLAERAATCISHRGPRRISS